MDHVIIRHAPAEVEQAIAWAKETPDGELLDLDMFEHQSTSLLSAVSSVNRLGDQKARMAYLPVQQPLMLENLIFRPGMSDRERAVAMTRMTEYAVSEAYRRDVGELYFLCRHAETCAFAEKHLFERIDGPESRLQLKVYRMNLRETFGN